MKPEAQALWRGPMWALSILLATLGMLGPFTIDTYLPAFAGIAADLNATPLQIQQTLSAYLFGFAFMSLFHGALSDSFGRRPVVLTGVAVFTLASMGCALSTDITHLILFRALQGLSTGAGIVVSRAVIRDMFAPSDAQRVMSQVTLFFGVAPAVAPIIGGLLFVSLGWHAIFWFLTLVGVALWIANWRLLPETFPPEQRQVLSVKNLMRGYWDLGTNARFVLLAVASGIPFNGMFLYVLSAPTFLGEHLQLAPTQFFWFFLFTISGIMGGAFISGRLAGRIPAVTQVRIGLAIMFVVSVANVVANHVFVAHVSWALIPIAFYTLGWAMMTPVVTLMALDVVPERRGMAASMQAFVGSAANGVVAGVIAPLVMHSTRGLAITAMMMMLVGLVAWVVQQRR